jgi:hypothetical protein
MDKATIYLIGHKLRKEFRPPEDLPYPMQMALKALARQPVRDGDNDNDVPRAELLPPPQEGLDDQKRG